MSLERRFGEPQVENRAKVISPGLPIELVRQAALLKALLGDEGARTFAERIKAAKNPEIDSAVLARIRQECDLFRISSQLTKFEKSAINNKILIAELCDFVRAIVHAIRKRTDQPDLIELEDERLYRRFRTEADTYADGFFVEFSPDDSKGNNFLQKMEEFSYFLEEQLS
jgi:hypothetical protein